jgi:hypothetical protein
MRSLNSSRIGEEQRRIPTEQHQAWNSARLGIARHVVIALDAFGLAENRKVRPPSVPQEFDDGNDDGQADARDCPEHGDTDRAQDRQPELPALDPVDTGEIAELEQSDCGGDDHRCERRIGEVLEQCRRSDDEQCDDEGADDAGHLRFGARGFGNWCS